MVEGDRTRRLDDVQWADWGADGRLLVVTVDGRLQVRDWSAGGLTVAGEEDPGRLAPAPAVPPDEASRW